MGGHVDDTLAEEGVRRFRSSPLQRPRHLLLRTLLVNLFARASSFCNDFLWWPLEGRRVRVRVRKKTSWGRPIDRYKR